MEGLTVMAYASLFCLHVDNDFSPVLFAHRNIPHQLLAVCVVLEDDFRFHGFYEIENSEGI